MRNFEVAQICLKHGRKGTFGVLGHGFVWLESFFCCPNFRFEAHWLVPPRLPTPCFAHRAAGGHVSFTGYRERILGRFLRRFGVRALILRAGLIWDRISTLLELFVVKVLGACLSLHVSDQNA